MATPSSQRLYLTPRERELACGAGVALVLIALLLVFTPPGRTQAVAGCTPSDRSRCTITVDGDPNVFAGVLAALGGAALLVGLLGIRFSSIKAGGVELASESFDDATRGLAPAPATGAAAPAAATAVASQNTLEAVVCEPPQLDVPISSIRPQELDHYRERVYDAHKRVFLTHLLGAPTEARQRYRVAVFLVGHDRSVGADTVASAVMYFGRHWGSQFFEASWGEDGRLGVVTEAYGPFLALCEVKFRTGERLLLHHYVDFEMGALLGK